MEVEIENSEDSMAYETPLYNDDIENIRINEDELDLPTVVRDSLTCSVCQKVFTKRCNLTRHLNTVHVEETGRKVDGYTCSSCGRRFMRIDILKRHFAIVHDERRVSHNCNICGVYIRLKSSWKRHMKTFHTSDDQKLKCANCDETFTNKRILLWHLKSTHSPEKSNYGIACVLCDSKFPLKSQTLRHLEDTHNVRIEREELEFRSIDEFDSWKRRVENASVCQFVKTHRSSTLRVYVCHRSGTYSSASTKRRSKMVGTKKLGGLCPAQICVRETSTGFCSVTFTKTHIGHPTADERELAYVFLNRSEREEIGEQIAAGVSLDCILRENSSGRLKLLNRQDLKNISRALRLNSVSTSSKQKTDTFPDSIDSFVDKYHDSILYHKVCDDNTFSLVLMTQTQRKMLEFYGYDAIAVDSCDNEAYAGFSLLSIVVLDEYKEAFPVAFAISNENDRLPKLLSIFLTSVREKVGKVLPNTLITDVTSECYKTWSTIMETTPAKWLYSTWHVNEAWRKDLDRVRELEKRTDLKRRLNELQLETFEHAFLEKLQEFEKDVDRCSFASCFRTKFVDSVKRWANCYRPNAYLRPFDFIFRRLKRSENIESTLNLLKRYLDTRENDQRVKIIRGKLTPKLKRLRSRHDYVEKIERDNAIVERIKSGEWLISSNTDEEGVVELYVVQRIEKQCEQGCLMYCEKCDICLHEYRCSCRDFKVKTNMCVHIHSLGLSLNDSGGIRAQVAETFEEEFDVVMEDPSDLSAEQAIQVELPPIVPELASIVKLALENNGIGFEMDGRVVEADAYR